jgi:hypothetical protein
MREGSAVDYSGVRTVVGVWKRRVEIVNYGATFVISGIERIDLNGSEKAKKRFGIGAMDEASLVV